MWLAGLPPSAPAQVAVEKWHILQSSAVAIWPALLPIALMPSWQVTHETGAVCVYVAGSQLKVLRWQSLQGFVSFMDVRVECLFPIATVSLWQLAQVPGILCLNLAGSQPTKPW